MNELFESRLPFTFKRIPHTIVGTKLEIPQNLINNNLLENEEVQNFQIRLQAYEHFIQTINKSNEESMSLFTKQLTNQSQLFHQLKSKDLQESAFSYHHRSQLSNTNLSINNSLNITKNASSNLFMLKIQNQKLKYKEKLLQQKLEYHKILKHRQSMQKNKESVNANKQLELKKRQRQLMRKEVSILEQIMAKKNNVKLIQQQIKEAIQLIDQLQAIQKQPTNYQIPIEQIVQKVQKFI